MEELYALSVDGLLTVVDVDDDGDDDDEGGR